MVTTEAGTVILQFSGEGKSHRSEWQGLGSGLENWVRGLAGHSGLQLTPRCPGCVGRRRCTPVRRAPAPSSAVRVRRGWVGACGETDRWEELFSVFLFMYVTVYIDVDGFTQYRKAGLRFKN